jgi:hypothetical protein
MTIIPSWSFIPISFLLRIRKRKRFFFAGDVKGVSIHLSPLRHLNKCLAPPSVPRRDGMIVLVTYRVLSCRKSLGTISCLLFPIPIKRPCVMRVNKGRAITCPIPNQLVCRIILWTLSSLMYGVLLQLMLDKTIVI